MTTSDSRSRAISAWLFAIAALVFAMIVLGGVTRLTKSGLSMVNWHPVTGWLPPLDAAGWEKVFADYRQYPEYKKINAGMTLDEFKGIFWYEYLHRLLGRLIGLAFLVPMVAFMAKGWITRALAPKIVGLFILGAMQGVLGWYMVKSGMIDRPDVSQYRLAAHLSLALLIFAALLWVGMDLRRPDPAAASPPGLRRGGWGLLALIAVTALSGAFVAGLDAGFVYNTFPLMDGALAPKGMFDLTPAYLNFFENILSCHNV